MITIIIDTEIDDSVKVSCFQMNFDFILDMFGVVMEHSIKMSVLSKLTDGKVDLGGVSYHHRTPMTCEEL